MLGEGFNNFSLEGDALSVINPIAGSLIILRWFVASIIAKIRTPIHFVSFWFVNNFRPALLYSPTPPSFSLYLNWPLGS